MRYLGDKVMQVLRQLRGPDTADAVFEATAPVSYTHLTLPTNREV